MVYLDLLSPNLLLDAKTCLASPYCNKESSFSSYPFSWVTFVLIAFPQTNICWEKFTSLPSDSENSHADNLKNISLIKVSNISKYLTWGIQRVLKSTRECNCLPNDENCLGNERNICIEDSWKEMAAIVLVWYVYRLAVNLSAEGNN